MTCEKCGLELRVERIEEIGLVVACRNQKCEEYKREKVAGEPSQKKEETV